MPRETRAYYENELENMRKEWAEHGWQIDNSRWETQRLDDLIADMTVRMNDDYPEGEVCPEH